MARDCPDRQRGSDWRNNGGFPGARGPGGPDGPRAIGTGDAVDREMEVSFSFRPRLFQERLLIFVAATHE